MPVVSIHIEALNYSYAHRTVSALDGIHLDMQCGAVTLIAGESGSGKTTLFRCINGLIPHSYANGQYGGKVLVEDHTVAATPLAHLSRHIGTVLQDPDKQMIASKVLNDIAFGLENLGLPRAEILTRSTGAARRVGIEHLLERNTHSLSGGEKQKVAIAGVLAMHPQILLFDEPLASLDPRSAAEVLGLLRSLADDGATVVMIEHRVRNALQIRPEQCVRLAQGQIKFVGDAAQAEAQWPPAPTAKRIVPPPSATASSPSAPALLEMRDLSFTYETSPNLLNGVSLRLHAGDAVALMGPNGAGKSTLSKLAIGLLRPQRGEVLLDGKPTHTMSVAQLAQHIGYVFQHPSAMLFANTLGDELSFGPRNIGMDARAIEQGIALALRQVNLGDLPLDRSPFALSYGQQKRVALASVLAMHPRLLFLDEPTAGLDDGTAHHMMENLLTGEHRPQAVCMITHDLELARRYANRVVILAEGGIAADGPPETVLNDQALLARCRLI